MSDEISNDLKNWSPRMAHKSKKARADMQHIAQNDARSLCHTGPRRAD